MGAPGALREKDARESRRYRIHRVSRCLLLGHRGRQAEIDALAFNYYAQAGNRKRAKELLADLKAVKGADRAVIADCQLTYDIVCGHRHDMIDKMEFLLPNANDAQKGKLYFLLAKQYANAGNKERARAYRARFDELKAAQRPQAPAEG